jgi:hypothetical protein
LIVAAVADQDLEVDVLPACVDEPVFSDAGAVVEPAK